MKLAKHGATIHLLSRDSEKAELLANQILIAGNGNIFIHYVNLNDFSTVRRFAEKFLATNSPIHVLINNAGLCEFGFSGQPYAGPAAG